jgi:hypothetical protein
VRKEPVCSCQDFYDKPSDRTDDKDTVTRTIAKRGSVACGTTAEQQIGGRIIKASLPRLQAVGNVDPWCCACAGSYCIEIK